MSLAAPLPHISETWREENGTQAPKRRKASYKVELKLEAVIFRMGHAISPSSEQETLGCRFSEDFCGCEALVPSMQEVQ